MNRALLIFAFCNFINVQYSVFAKFIPNLDDELVGVTVLYRHGDRSPISSFPNDYYYNDYYWPDGYGQLNNAGKMRQFELGWWLRDRYDSLLSYEYKPDEILVVTSDVDRCHMSAASNLAGLYNPGVGSEWLGGLVWDPVPIHTYAEKDDILLDQSKDCPKYSKLYSEVKQSDYFKQLLVEYADMIQYVSEKSGWEINDIDKLGTLWSVCYVYRMHNSSYIPAWVYDVDPDNLTYLAGVHFARETFNTDLKRLKAGPLISYIVSHFDNLINGNGQKFLMLSAHDGTVVSVLNSLDVYDLLPPEFTATIIWELRVTKEGKYYISMLYKKPSVTGLKELVLNNCEFNCDYDQYKTVLDSMSLLLTDDQWEQECQSS